MTKNLKWIILFLTPATLFFLYVYAIPIIVLFTTSFTEWTIGTAPKFIGINNYIDLLTNDSDFIKAGINTGIWILLQSTIHVALGVLCALILARKKFYWKFTRTVYMIPNIISSAALGMMFLMIFNPTFGAVNSLIRIMGIKDFGHNWFLSDSTAFLAVTIIWLPFAANITILVLAEMSSIPPSILEAAYIDGVNAWKKIRYLTIPMLKPTFILLFLFGLGGILRGSFDLFYNLIGNNSVLYPQTDIIDTYVFRSLVGQYNFSMGAAAGFYQSVFGLVIVLAVNFVVKKVDPDNALF